uniref:Uncharacterized protein n=1 Tax=Panagrolaimus sp. PS1159 TaxID=55785 RepID=A0AC35F0D2_9BILA
MELIAKIHSTNNNSSKLIFKICKMFYISAKDRVKDINVTDKLWIDAWNICVKNEYLQNLEAPFALDLLFHIKKPETNERKIIIKDFVRKMISENETLRTAVIWINTFQLKEIKEEQFGAIVAYSLFFEDGMKNTLNQFNSGEDIIQYLITLDSWLKHTESNGLLNFLGQNNKDVVVDTLLSPISSTVNFIKYNSRRFAIEKKLENLNFHAYDEVFVYETKKKFEYMDRKYFEVYAKEVLKGANEKRKRYFLKSVSNDKMYAYCWAKYLRIDDHDLPEELKKYIISGVNVSEFIENIDNLKSHCVDKDSIEDCHFWNKSYKLITVISPEALSNFINEYLIHSIIIGIDCESGRSF